MSAMTPQTYSLRGLQSWRFCGQGACKIALLSRPLHVQEPQHAQRNRNGVRNRSGFAHEATGVRKLAEHLV